MGREPKSLDQEVDRSLADAATIVRRSQEAAQRLDAVLHRQRGVIRAADGAVELAGRVMAEVDVNLASLERRAADGRPPRARVLVVDDNPSIREVLRVLLDLEVGDDAEVRTVASGAEAVESARWSPHVVILDWQMPVMDGLETARRLRSMLGPGPRIVMYSSMIARDAEGDALAAGADSYVEKGADVDALVAEVAAAVAARDRRRRQRSS